MSELLKALQTIFTGLGIPVPGLISFLLALAAYVFLSKKCEAVLDRIGVGGSRQKTIGKLQGALIKERNEHDLTKTLCDRTFLDLAASNALNGRLRERCNNLEAEAKHLRALPASPSPKVAQTQIKKAEFANDHSPRALERRRLSKPIPES